MGRSRQYKDGTSKPPVTPGPGAQGRAYSITGIPVNTIPIRQDVDEWYHEQNAPGGNRIQPTLITEALTAIKQRPLTDEKSYFRLAGIHAAPYAGWGGFDNPKEQDDPSFYVHNDYTCPAWHRVYMVLFEQVMHETIIELIDAASDLTPKMRSDWKREASCWRLPYWDFSKFATHNGTPSDELRLPILAIIPNVSVKVFSSEGRLFDKCISTTKYGLLDGYDADIWADGGQNWLRANQALNEHPWYQNQDEWDSNPTLQDMTYRLLKYQGASWGSFATTRASGTDNNPKMWLNLEAIHNNVGNWVGGFMFKRPTQKPQMKLWGAGHMAEVPVAAFDPIFWLHHSNIDRLNAIWQSLNPEKWFDDDYSSVTRENELKPFRNDQGFFFKSDFVRDWRKFNYDYAITSGNRDGRQIMQDVERLYGQKTKEHYQGCPQREDYIITVKYDRPFQINVFFGPVDSKDFYDTRSKNFVGSVFNFSAM
ncbi:Tyrosinase [Cytospora mali]|uniref:tyrosinase n=1 Tax=Cytospora mali TaxID=578113 RepID=A0A194WE27_CYTMA|nr:Tyrosinase [Valsa mali]